MTVAKRGNSGFPKEQCPVVPDWPFLLSGDASSNCRYELSNGSGRTIGERSARWLSGLQNRMPIRSGGAGEASVMCS